MDRSERPATGSYALVAVEIKKKGTWHVVKGQFPTVALISGNPTLEQARDGKSHSQSSVLTPDDVLVGSQCKDAGRWPFRCPEL